MIFSFARTCSVEETPTLAFKNSNWRRRWMARVRGNGKATRVLIHSLCFQTRLHTWLSWLRRSLFPDALTCLQFEPCQDHLVFSLFQTFIFSIFSYFLII